MSNGKVAMANVVRGWDSNKMNEIAEGMGKSYDDVEKLRNDLVKEYDRAKAYRTKKSASLKEFKSFIS
jgi:hypothetical protein